MRIVHLETGRHLHGGARQVRDAIDGLARLGVDNVLLCPRGSAIARCDLPAEVVELSLSGDLDVGQTARLARELRRLAPDVLHVHSRRGADLFGGWAARRVGIPAVLTRRVESVEPVSWARFKFRPYRRVIAISQAIRDELLERVELEPPRVALVPSAVDTQRYTPPAERGALARQFELPAGAIVLGNVAQLIARKGHATLLGAVARLATARPQLHLICFGRGPLAGALQRQTAALGLVGRVHWAGFREDLAALLPELDVLVHPAEREGLGVAVLEAMAAGVPVVAARAGGIPDVVEDGLTGLLVARGDEAALAAAIERILDDAALRAALIERGRRRVEEKHSIERMAGANLEIYRDVMEEVKGGDGSER